jgi:branched-chain amino acid transport system substrate-binding protein
VIVSLIAAASFLTACERFDDQAEARSARARKASGDILVGVVWPPAQTSSTSAKREERFWDGIEAAERQLEARGGVAGRRLRIVRSSDDGTISLGKRVAQDLADDPDVVAVIGYAEPSVANVASITYEFSNVLMISTGPSTPRLTREGFLRIFRTLPTDEEFGTQLADYAKKNGLARILVVQSSDARSMALANAFEARAEQQRLSVVDRLAWDRGAGASFVDRVKPLRGTGISAVLLALGVQDAVEPLTTLRAQGIDAPVLFVDFPESVALTRFPEVSGGIVASVFDPSSTDAQSAAFTQAFAARYGRPPDTWAAQAYDGLLLLGEAIARAGSSDPAAVSNALRLGPDFHGVTGAIRFNGRGEAIDRQVVFRRVQGGGGSRR